MHEEIRKEFNFKEQKVKDIILAVDTIFPVISIIRKWGESEKEYNICKQEIKTMQHTLNDISDKMDTASVEQLRDILMPEFEEIQRKYDETLSKIKQIYNICKTYEREVIQYQKYARLFNWITISDLTNVLEIFKPLSEERLTILFIIFNNNDNSISIDEYDTLMEMFNSSVKNMDLILLLGWDYVVKKLKSGEL